MCFMKNDESNVRVCVIDDTEEGNRELCRKHAAEYARRLETDIDFVQKKKQSPDWPRIRAKAIEPGIKIAGEE